MNNKEIAEKTKQGIPMSIAKADIGGKDEGMGISGHIKVWITDNITGVKRLHFENKNAIQANYAGAIVDHLDHATTVLFGVTAPLFNGNTNLGAGNDGESGIALEEDGGLFYEMIMATPVQSGGNVTFVGTFTGLGITVTTGAQVLLGRNWVNAGTSFGAAGAEVWAVPAGWVATPVLITETLTIEWIIKHQSA